MKTKAEYKAYKQAVENFLLSNNVKSGCFGPKNSDSEGFFSWQFCECCNSELGGNRETYLFRQNDGGLFEADICTDCIYYLHYDGLDDESMLEIEASQD